MKFKPYSIVDRSKCNFNYHSLHKNLFFYQEGSTCTSYSNNQNAITYTAILK